VNTPPLILEASLPELFTTKEAMHYLRISRSTLYRLRTAGHLVGYQVGSHWRYDRSDLIAYVKGSHERSIL